MVQRKTNRGQIIDMEALIAAQGDRPAMGNAGTDAHGNVLGPDGKIETPAEERVRAYYQDNPMSSTGQQSLKGNQPQAEFTPEDVATTKVLIEAGSLSFDGLISDVYSAKNANKAYNIAFNNAECLKMVLDWRNAA